MKIYKIAISILLYWLPVYIYSQDNDTSKSVTLDEVLVTANKTEEIKRNIAQQVLLLSAKQIENTHAQSTADLISSSGVPVQKSQLGGGSPVLRGFEASRIILMIDGVRLNNLIYRTGHLQDIVKTDNSNLDRVEILYGPSSTLYGSDALGGVIHLLTKKPQLSTDGKTFLKGQAFARYESADKGFTGHIEVNTGGKKMASFTSVTYSKFNDLKGGKNQNPFYGNEYGIRPLYAKYIGNGKDTLIKNSDRYLQVGSAYFQYDLLQKVLYQPIKGVSHNLNIQYSNSGNVPRYDRLTDPSNSTGLKSAEWYYGPQTRFLSAYDLNLNNKVFGLDYVHLGVNYQWLQESRHNRNFNSRFLNNRIEKVQIAGINLDLLKVIVNHELRFGIDAQLNRLKSSADRKNIIDNTIEKLDSRYPDGDNSMNNMAVYISHTWKLSNNFIIVDGLRAGYSVLKSTLIDTAIMFHLPYTDIEQKTPVYSGNIGIISTPNDHLKFSLLISTGYRVPNVDDISKIFGSAPGMVIVPNKELKPEKTVNYELGITKIFGTHTRWENSIYYTDYRDIAVLDTYLFNGRDSIQYDGSMSRVFANQNKDKAYIYGFSSCLVSKPDEHFTISAGINYTYGRIKTDSSDVPLDHIPPFTARSSFQYNYKLFSSEFFIIYNGWKKLKDYYLNGEDNEQYATEDGMPAWFTMNLRLSYQIHKNLSVQAGIDNIFDTQYRTFASGINAPGRNFIFALKGSF